MTSDFEFVTEGPEDYLRGCRMATTEELVARDLEEKYNLEVGDVRAERTFRDGKPHFQIFRRKIRTTDCLKERSWLEAVEECLQSRQAFELLNANPALIARL